LEARFAKHQEQSLRLNRINPIKILSTNWKEILSAVTKYSSLLNATVSTVKREFVSWQQHWRGTQFNEISGNTLDALNKCSRVTIPSIHMLLKVLATLLVSTTTPERVFSKVERTLTALNSAITDVS
jgi:hypothetical protein